MRAATLCPVFRLQVQVKRENLDGWWMDEWMDLTRNKGTSKTDGIIT